MEVKFNSALLPLRDIVVFPHMVIPLFVGRDKSITALNEVMKKDKNYFSNSKNSEVDDPKKMIFLITDVKVAFYNCSNYQMGLLKF